MNVRPRCTVSPCFCRCRFLPPAVPPRLLDLCRRIHGKPGVRLQQMLGLLGWRLGGGDRGSCGSAAACGPCYALPPRKGQSGAGYIFSGAATRAGPVLEDSHHRLADFNPGMTNVGGASLLMTVPTFEHMTASVSLLTLQAFPETWSRDVFQVWAKTLLRSCIDGE